MSRLFDALQKALATSQGTDIQAVFLPGDLGKSAGAATSPPGPAEDAAEPGGGTPNPARTAPSGYRSVRLQMQGGVPALPFDGSAPRAAEQYRIIRTRIVHDSRQPQICLVSSPTPGDGKTITTLNIAASLALKTSVTALLVECDLRRPSIAHTLGISAEPGLAGVLEGTCPFQDAIVQVEEIPGFHIMPAGQAHANPTELLDSARWREVCATLKHEFQYSVLDSPPVGSVADYELLENSAEGVILVVRPDCTHRTLCSKAIERIPKEKLLGVVINCAKDWFLHRPPSSKYYYAAYR